MPTKSIIISSSGLKNIVLNKYQEEEDFIFIFGDQQFKMKRLFSEFISPVVSHLHQIDPTFNSINLIELTTANAKDFNELCKNIVTPDTISLLQQISSGFSIEINEDQAIKLRFLSILLCNEELHDKLNELFPQNYSEENVNFYLKNIDCCYHYSTFNADFDYKSLISFVASHFYQLDKHEFLNLSRFIQYQIISHPQLQIESEDSLFDIIIEIIEKKKEGEEIDDVLFLEQIEFIGLSESKLRMFVDVFDVNEMNGQLWYKFCQRVFNHSNKKSKRIVNKIQPCIIVSGYDEFNQLGEKPNNKNFEGQPIISPPLKSSLDPSFLLSYSSYDLHSVLIMNDNSLWAAGDNCHGRISSSLMKTKITQFTEFSINDGSGNKLTPISAVCCDYGTVYMLSKSDGNGNQLVFCDQNMNDGSFVFLDIGNQQPVALFGGNLHAAAISGEGQVIFINRESVIKLHKSQISPISLPDGEKASSVACCDGSVIVSSSNGRVFSAKIENKKSLLNFSLVEELANEEIIYVSGTDNHFLAVSKEGHVFGCGSNDYGQLGINKETDTVSSFTEITSLRGYKIRAAYAGCDHSLFETYEGKILSCGCNDCGQLLLRSGPGEDVYSPMESAITEGATFCIAEAGASIVFIGNKPPSNMPNMPIQYQ